MSNSGRPKLDRKDINREALTDPKGLVERENAAYIARVGKLTDLLLTRMGERHLVMLSGPSSAGKTTTAGMLCRNLATHGVETFVVSVDDFYRGRGLAPMLPNGHYDYEALEALDLERLRRCMNELMTAGESDLPIFDFVTGKPSPEVRHLVVPRHAAVIVEGIHAINPIFETHVDRARMTKVFVDPSRIMDGDTIALTRRQIRMARRILRDNRFRNSPPDNTLRMWPQVVRGELTYMFPYADTVDFRVETTHGFEMGMYREELCRLLCDLPDSEAGETAEKLRRAAESFEPISRTLLPADSLICEFLGNPATNG